MFISLLYISTSVWVLRTPNSGQSLLFSCIHLFTEVFDAKISNNKCFLSLFSNAGQHKNSCLTPYSTSENTFSDTENTKTWIICSWTCLKYLLFGWGITLLLKSNSFIFIQSFGNIGRSFMHHTKSSNKVWTVRYIVTE